MKNLFTKWVMLIAALFMTGCSQMNNQDVGTVTGAVAGGLLGSQFGRGGGQMLAIGAGTLAGAYFGGKIGQSMDETDRLKMSRTFESNNVGQPAYWRNQNTGAQYTVTPTKNVTVRGNRYCREYRTTAIVAGKEQQVYGTACRQPDGSWKVIN